MNITQAILKLLLSYNKETGALVWLPRNRCLFKSDRDHKRWNTKFSGKTVGSPHNNGRGNIYLKMSLFGEKHYCHRIVWMYLYGKFPLHQIDHIDGDEFNNAEGNLRDASVSINQKNRSLCRANTTGHIGVMLVNGKNKWRVKFKSDGKHINVGRFKTIEEALEARDAAYKKYGFHANHGRQRSGCH